MIEITEELVIKNVSFLCVISNSTGIGNYKSRNGRILPGKHLKQFPKCFIINRLETLKIQMLSLSHFRDNSIPSMFVL